MTWSMLGWVMIGLSAGLLFGLSFLAVKNEGHTNHQSAIADRLKASRVGAIEQGKKRQVVLGHQLWSRTYPGLGLHALSLLPAFLDPESIVDGGQTISGADGPLMVFARQLMQGQYQDGFSISLHHACLPPAVYGPTPLSFTAGFLPELSANPCGSLVLLGDYGPESLLWVEAAKASQGAIFAAAGSLHSQAALFMAVDDLLIGEEVYKLPGLLRKTPWDWAAWLTEDLIRILLISFLIIGAILKMVGVL